MNWWVDFLFWLTWGSDNLHWYSWLYEQPDMNMVWCYLFQLYYCAVTNQVNSISYHIYIVIYGVEMIQHANVQNI